MLKGELSGLEIFALILFIFSVVALIKDRTLFFVFIFFLPVTYYLRVRAGITVNSIDIMVISLFSAALMKMIIRKEAFYISKFEKAVFVYILYSFILLLTSPINGDTLGILVHIIETGMIYFLIVYHVRSIYDVKKIFYLLLIAAFLQGLLAWYQFFFLRDMDLWLEFNLKLQNIGLAPYMDPNRILAFFYGGEIPRVSGTLGLGCSLTLYLMPMVLLSIILCITEKRIEKRVVYLLVITIIASAQIFTLGRTGIYATGMALLATLFYDKKINLYHLIFLGLLFYLIIHFILPKEPAARIFTQTGESIGTIRGRIFYWTRSLEIIKSNILLGAGTAGLGGGVGQAKPHSQFLYEFQTKGIGGFFLFLYLVFIFLKKSFVLVKVSYGFYRSIILWIFACLVGYSFAFMFSAPLAYIHSSAIFWIVLGLVRGLALEGQNSKFFK